MIHVILRRRPAVTHRSTGRKRPTVAVGLLLPDHAVEAEHVLVGSKPSCDLCTEGRARRTRPVRDHNVNSITATVFTEPIFRTTTADVSDLRPQLLDRVRQITRTRVQPVLTTAAWNSATTVKAWQCLTRQQ